MKKTIAILVNYNNYKDTIEAVYSLRKQSVPFHKILITDNNSTDNSFEILQKELQFDNVIILQSNHNNGFAFGNNFAIKYALKNLEFKYFLMINNDTISDENLNKSLIEYYENNDPKKIGILTGKILNYYQRDKILAAGGIFNKIKCSGYHIGDGEIDNGQYNSIKECTFATGCLWFFHRSLISKVGYLPEEYFLYLEDVDYCLQVRKANLKIIYLPTVKIWHKEGATTKVTKTNPNFYYTNRNRIIVANKFFSKKGKVRFYLFFFTSRIIRFIQYLIQGKQINTFRGIAEGFSYIKSNSLSVKLEIEMLRKLILYLLNLPIYIFSSLVKKDKNIWVFGAWYGENYSDNSKYLFEFVNKNYPNIRTIWLSKNRNVIKEIRGKGFRSYHTFSFYGYWFSIKAKVVMVTHSRLTDLNFFAISNLTKIIQLWHGIPLKKIYFDDTKSAQRFSGKNSKLKELIFPFLNERFDLLITTSFEFQDIAAKAFNMSKEKIRITGYPRNDVFFGASQKQTKNKIIYLPTLRKTIGSEIDMFFKFGFDAKKISKMLNKHNAELYLKLHPVNIFEKDFIDLISQFNNINILYNIDIYDSINDYNILITDFSSIYFDFLLTDKPIIFTTFDKEEFIKDERELYFNYDEITPGEKADNWNDVLIKISEILELKDNFKENRKQIKKRFFRFNDGENSERVYNLIKDFVDGER